jgi:hypothetical protein
VFEWQGSTYRMVAIDWNNLTLEAQELATSIISRIPLSAIWGMDGSLPITEEFRDRPDLAGSTVAGLPDHYLAKADLVIEVETHASG